MGTTLTMDQYFAAIGNPNGWDQIGFTAEAVKASAVSYVNQALPGLSAQERAIAGEIAAYRAEAAYQGTAARYWENQASKATGTMAQEFSERAAQFRSSSDAAIKAAGDASKSLGAGALQEIALGLKTFANQVPGIVSFWQLADAIGSNDLYKVGETCVSLLAQIGIGALTLEALLLVGAPVAVAGGLAILAGYLAGKLYEGFWKDSTADFLGIKQGDRLSDRLNEAYLIARNWVQRRDPLAIDLDRDGIETIGVGTVLFDHDGDGIKTGTGWVKGDDGFLVLDRNLNGTIDNGSELFGVDTVLGNGQKAPDGFSALRELDANADGKFDAADAFYNTVRVWQDTNQDGISQAEELKTLASLGITSIDLNAHNATRNLGNGNIQTLTAAAAGVGDAANLDLAQNPFFSEFTDHIPLTEQAKTLPSMQGSGMVRNLQEAASLSPTLTVGTALLGSIAKRSDFMSQLDFVLEQWADTSSMKTTIQQGWDVGIGSDLTLTRLDIHFLLPGQTRSYLEGHGYSEPLILDPTASDEARQQFEATKAAQAELTRRIGILERFNGQRFLDFGSTSVKTGAGVAVFSSSTSGGGGSSALGGISAGVPVRLSQQQVDSLNQSYNDLKKSVYQGLVLQTRLKHYLDAITLDVTDAGISLNFDALYAQLDALKTTDVKNALIDAIELNAYTNGGLQDAGCPIAARISSWVNDPENAAVVSSVAQELGTQKSGSWSGTNQRDFMFGSTTADYIYGYDGNDHLFGLAGNDYLSGGNGDDVLDGGAGNDMLYGEAGNDTYVFGRGGGVDTVNNTAGDWASTTDSVTFGEGVALSDLDVAKDGGHLRITIKGATDSLIIQNWFSGEQYRVDRFQFADGSVLTAAELEARGYIIRGGDSSDNLSGYSGSDILQGNNGSDTLYGAGGNDTLEGGSGNDTLYGQDGNDVISGGPGDDYLEGNKGNDTYLFSRGDGNDRIRNWEQDEATATDVLKLGEGITKEDLVFSHAAGSKDLLMSLCGSNDSVTFVNAYYNGYYGAWDMVDSIELSSGERLMSNQVEQLIQAMASFSSSNGMTWSQAIQQKPTEAQAVLASFWQAT